LFDEITNLGKTVIEVIAREKPRSGGDCEHCHKKFPQELPGQELDVS
jgi:hypothetical protein